MTSMLYTMSSALSSLLSLLAEMKSAWQILKPRKQFSRVEKNLSNHVLCMVSKPIKGLATISSTDGNTEQLNVFGRNLNTVSRTFEFVGNCVHS